MGSTLNSFLLSLIPFRPGEVPEASWLYHLLNFLLQQMYSYYLPSKPPFQIIVQGLFQIELKFYELFYVIWWNNYDMNNNSDKSSYDRVSYSIRDIIICFMNKYKN